MSEPNKLQVTSFLNSINDHMLVRVAQSRNLRVDSLKYLPTLVLLLVLSLWFGRGNLEKTKAPRLMEGSKLGCR